MKKSQTTQKQHQPQEIKSKGRKNQQAVSDELAPGGKGSKKKSKAKKATKKVATKATKRKVTKKTKGRLQTKIPLKAPAAKGLKLPAPLAHGKVYRECPTSAFKFRHTKELEPCHDIIAQSRAKRAIDMGLGITRPGYNIFVSGIQGTGKTSVIKQQLEKWAKTMPVPDDWLYLYNFQNHERPNAVRVAGGCGRKFKKEMEHLVKGFRSQIPSALQSEDYETAVNILITQMNERKSKLFSELEKLARSMDFVIKSSRMGIETIPVFEGRALNEKDYSKLSDAVRDHIEAERAKLEPEVLDFARKVRGIEAETRDEVEALRTNLGNQIVSAMVAPLKEDFADNDELVQYLEQVEEYVVENLLDFVEDDDEEERPAAPEDRQKFNKYKVNLFIDHSESEHAPIIIENNPTYYNLFGKIEKNVEHGMYLTDFSMIKPGAIHQANGGYLVINVLDIFRNSLTWETLKRVLRNRTAFIEDMGEQYSMLPTSGLRPEVIPLEMKVILIGNDELYHLLYEEDEEFHKIFKIKADFDWRMTRNASNIKSYISFIATRTILENLLPFDRSAVAAVVEHSSRLIEDQRYLSTQFGEVKDLTIEADFVAREEGARQVKRSHVERAIMQKYDRLNLQEEHLLNLVETNDILIQVDGAVVGQINGLAVYDYGDYAFGKIGRITCTTSISDNGIINIERAAHLSGKIHDKGMHILSGFLHSVLARKRRLGLSASVCFEQSYGIIDGDSASAAELIAILSAMAEIPIRQDFAITGSVSQLGEIQSIGGVNEKIEGFFKVCERIGKGKTYSVVIPKHNCPNLMLHADVREHVKSGRLRVYPITHIAEAFALMTGVPLGIRSVFDTEFVKGSALAMIDEKLEQIYQEEESHFSDNPVTEKAPTTKAAAAARS